MLANFGYKDGSGEYFIRIDTDKCNGCGDCVPVCPSSVLLVVDEDPNDPLREGPVATVGKEKIKKLKYECNPCKPVENRPPLPCVAACTLDAIHHSW